MILTLLFWLSFAAVAYVYIGYPVLLMLSRRLLGRSVRKARIEPTVTILIAAHNERNRIERRLQNCFELDYPRRKLQIIVATDGPTDGTEFVVWKYAARGVELAHSKEHLGKPHALNVGMRRAKGDIVVFADSRQMFERDAIRKLVANFADSSVGAVSGELVLLEQDGTESKSDVGLYWKYEKWIRAMESDVHSLVGATGAIYAIRRELFESIPEGTILDDVYTPMRVVASGHRVVFEPEARAYDEVSCCPRAEFGRKVRTLMGNYQLIQQMPGLLLPWSNPVMWQFVSHKVGRLLVPHLLITMLVSNVFLSGGFYSWILAAQLMWYAFAAIGHSVAKQNLSVPVLRTEEQRRAA